MFASTSTHRASCPTARQECPGKKLQQPQKVPGPKPPKIRGSCDSCGTAKVRCSKDRPSCERCIESNFPCVYGLSLKHGKGAQKRRHTEPQPVANSLQPTSRSLEPTYDKHLQQSFSDLTEDIGSSVHLWPSNNNAALPEIAQCSTSPITSLPTYNDPYWAVKMNIGHVGTNGTETTNPTSHGHTNGYPTAFDGNLVLDANRDIPQAFNHLDPKPISSPSSSASPTRESRITPSPQASIPKYSSGPHDCYAIVNSTLAVLHISPHQIPTTKAIDYISTLSSTSGVNVATHPVQDFDEVVCCTREAIGNVVHLLECTCAGDPQMAMLNASIIIRILYWHQVAAGIKTPTPSALPSNDLSSLTEPSSTIASTAFESDRSSCSTSAAFISSERIQIGKYVPSQGDQERMRRFFLLIRLKRLGRLVDQFAHAGYPDDVGTGHLRDTLASWLNAELSQTIKVVERAANAAID